MKASHRQPHKDDDIRGFLERELPPGKKRDAPLIAGFLQEASERYDRYSERRDDWRNYNRRRRQVMRIAKLAGDLVSGLSELDILTRDDFSRRFDSRLFEALVGSLSFLQSEAKDLADAIQSGGRPKDLADERWILEVADVYENAFNRNAVVWGTSSARRRGPFYSLLQISRPKSFARWGKLNPRQIDRVLKRRRKPDLTQTPISDGSSG